MPAPAASGARRDVRIVGVATNLGFLLDTLAQPDVVDGHASTPTGSSGRGTADGAARCPTGVARRAGDGRDPWRRVRRRRHAAARESTVAGVARSSAAGRIALADDELEPPSSRRPADRSRRRCPRSVLRVDGRRGDRGGGREIVAVLEAMKIQVQVRGAGRRHGRGGARARPATSSRAATT